MTEQELRALVRDAIAHHAGSASVRSPAEDPPRTITIRSHSSHAMFAVPEGADVGGPCIIEPAVACNHCGYCKSLGH
jgi:hypothetical protein